ncbi:hypothetical protein EJ02DRAFT_504445 [Clathrospora elynae]|uniref:Uncharacterized protein n=1 Tax=Clathrospora elynae TaxID=706981 RepID=A0A6A5SH62_9PLEO|nr:hypothetical protein EJ02DRAFT_504445 [Clathrospora elynae]
MEFTRLVPKADTQLPAVASRDTYFRTMTALMSNVSTSAWITDTSLTFPFWPSSEVAQLGPKLVSYGAWNTETTTLQSTYDCHNMKLESVEMSNKRYPEVYSVQLYGCKYELTVHPISDLAYNGGATWSDVTTFFPTSGQTITVGGTVVAPNVTSTHIYARLNTSDQFKGQDIILMNTPWTAPRNLTEIGPFTPVNTTYERSPDFRRRGMLCSSQYFVSKNDTTVKMSQDSQNSVNTSAAALSLRNDWRAYFDQASMQTDAKRAACSTLRPTDAGVYPGYSGAAPILAALSGFNLTSLVEDPDIAQTASRIKGRFFMETVRETLNSPNLVQTDTVTGNVTVVEERVVVLTEMGFTLAALFFLSAIPLAFVLWTSRLPRRPIKLHSDPASTVGLSLLLQPRLGRASTFRSMHSASRSDFYSTLQRENYRTSDKSLLRGSTQLGNFPTFAPISIAPTVVSIVIGLWWDQLDMTFRILQPYISMSRGPTSISAGAGLTYRSKSWVGAAFKAARYRHWVLFMVTVGSVLARVLTISMSALFEKRPTNVIEKITLQRGLEIRRSPLVSEHSFNGSQLPWTFEGWSFLTVDLSHISNSTRTRYLSGSADSLAISSTNISVVVPAIRARLECSLVEEMSNVSSWLDLANLTESDYLMPEDLARLNVTGSIELYQLPPVMFMNTTSETTTLSTGNYITCCANGTIDQPQRSVMGYWSVAWPSGWQQKNQGKFPYYDMPWPLSIVARWVVGKAISVQGLDEDYELYFKEPPRIQSAHCRLVIETAEASVSVDSETGTVLSYEISGPATAMDLAWDNVFSRHEPSPAGSLPINHTYLGPLNITTSFGVLFGDALLGSADRNPVIISQPETLYDNAFVIRDPNHEINMDLMTNSMYALFDKNAEALLDYKTLVDMANRTFQTFFQHFVNSGLSLDKGGFTYEAINDDSTYTTALSAGATSRNITASISNRIRVLHMNTVATYLSTAILIWLIGTTLIIVCLQRKYTSAMVRDVQLVADMLVLIAGSDNFLELVQGKGVALKREREVKTMLGWFKDRDGEIRWGIEVVGGRNAVEWVDAPKQGNDVRAKTSYSGRWLSWKKS